MSTQYPDSRNAAESIYSAAMAEEDAHHRHHGSDLQLEILHRGRRDGLLLAYAIATGLELDHVREDFSERWVNQRCA